MTLNKKQTKCLCNSYKFLVFLFISPIFLTSYQSNAQDSYKLSEMEINRTINLDDDDNYNLPTNPFEIVDRIRRANIMNDATKPSDAIDDAIKSFDMINEDKQIWFFNDLDKFLISKYFKWLKAQSQKFQTRNNSEL